ncbi:MAG: SseB family protein [Ornithinimicrobium sp.]
MTGRFEGHHPEHGHDTAGVPWQGRTLAGTGFDADEGAGDPALLAALGAADDDAEITVMAALSAARLIIPIVAVPGEGASSDMAAVTLSAPDGRKALPAFTSIEQLTRWDATARPVPVSPQRAALAAVQEGCDVVLLDLGTEHTRELRTSMVWALAMGREWQPAHRDHHVAAAVHAATNGERQIARWALDGGSDGALVIRLTLKAGLTPPQINELLERVGGRIASDGEARARIDAIAFRLIEDPGPG